MYSLVNNILMACCFLMNQRARVNITRFPAADIFAELPNAYLRGLEEALDTFNSCLHVDGIIALKIDARYLVLL